MIASISGNPVRMHSQRVHESSPRMLGRVIPPHDTVGAHTAAAAAAVARFAKDVGGVVGVRARGQRERGERRGGRRYGRLAGEGKECVARACKG
jgi:hypothetical protein